MTVDLAIPLMTALTGNASIVALLPDYLGAKTVFTRRPIPTDAPYPMILVSPDIAVGDQDGINDLRPIPMRDISVFGQNDTPQKYRDVEAIALLVRSMFHRQRTSLSVTGWHVIQVRARGPFIGPVDDDQTIARIVSLTIELAKAT